MLNLLRRKSRPHRRWLRACTGTGMRGKWASLYPSSTRGHDDCLVCGQNLRVRKHKSREHKDWKVGTLVFHTRDHKPAWWERFMEWGW